MKHADRSIYAVTARRLGAMVALTLVLAPAACRAGGAPPVPDAPATDGAPSASTGAAASLPQPVFADITAASGLDFSYRNGRSGALYLGEIMGGGAALLDYDGDGDLDMYLAQGRPLRPKGQSDGGGAGLMPGGPDTAVPEGDSAWSDRLYRNDAAAGEPPRYTDVTTASGIREMDYGVGAATGDYDGDGWVDLYVINWGANRLWRNKGDGSFEDVTDKAGAADERWSAAATFLDYDRDGHLDLFVVNYLDYDYGKHHDCFNADGSIDYCGPKAYGFARDRLLHNKGDGSFEDVTEAMGLLAADGPGLAVAAADLNEDGWVDLYVANDQAENLLWLNQDGKRFTNGALGAGVAVDRQGRSQASMGISPADVDRDNDLDLFITNLKTEYNTLYTNVGQGLFEDRTADQALGRITLPYTSFGTCALDLQSDGWPDLATANGAVIFEQDQVKAGDDYPLKQANQLLLNQGDGSFVDANAQAGPAFTAPNVGRGLACGDLDNDGDTDLVVARNEGPPLVLLNRAADGVPWLGLRLLDADGKRYQTGATVGLMNRPGRSLLHTDGSYASAHDPRLRFGLGGQGDPGMQTVEVSWPDGATETFAGLAPGRYHALRQGGGG